MTNEEKAKEICDKMGFHNEPFLRATYREDVEQAIEEGMQWKDEQHKQEKQQWIEKACERLEDYFAPDGSMVPENIWLWRDLQRVIKGEQL